MVLPEWSRRRGDLLTPFKLAKVNSHWELVLSLIIADKRNNKMIDKHRGVLLVPIALENPDVLDEQQEENNEEEELGDNHEFNEEEEAVIEMYDDEPMVEEEFD